MEASLEILSPTARVLRVTVAQRRFAEQVERRLRQVAKKLRMDGFRPGRVPVAVVRQLHLKEVYGDVVEELAEASLREALDEKQLRPAAAPEIEVEKFGEDRPLEYRAKFDVFPQLAESAVRELELTVPEIVVEESDVEDGVERLRREAVTWKAVARPAREGDQVKIVHETCEAAETPAAITGDSPKLELELGRSAGLSELLKQLEGMSAGDEKETGVISLNVPDAPPGNMRDWRLRVRVEEVREAVLPDPEDPAWLRRYGAETSGEVRALVRRHLEYRRASAWRDHLAVTIMEALVEPSGSALPVPESLRRRCLQSRIAELGLSEEERRQLGERIQEEKENHPLCRAALLDARGVTAMECLVELSGVELGARDLERAEEAYAGQFRDPAAARRRARSDPGVSRSLQSEALWDALIRWTLDRARVNRERTTLRQWTRGTKP